MRARKPSPAMLVALLALFVALGGSSYAALNLPRASVGGKQLKKNAVTSPKVKPGSLLLSDFRASQRSRLRGPQGPQGLQGPPGQDLRTLYGRASAAANEELVLSWPAMGLEVRTYDPDAGDSVYHVRVRNTNPPGGTRFYVTVGGTATPVPPGASNRFGGLTGLVDAQIVENLGSGRMVKLSCFANVISAEDDDFMQCMALTAGPE